MRDTRGQSGPYKPHGDICSKEYIGDDLDCGYGAGWHHFKHSDFWPKREG